MGMKLKLFNCCILCLLSVAKDSTAVDVSRYVIEKGKCRDGAVLDTVALPSADHSALRCSTICVRHRECSEFNVRLSASQCDLFTDDRPLNIIEDEDCLYGRVPIKESPCDTLVVQNGRNVTGPIPHGQTVSIECDSGFDINETLQKCHRGVFPTNPAYCKPSHCVLLIGGNRPLEHYHPTVECNVPEIVTTALDTTIVTSGCYLEDQREILIRESMKLTYLPSMLYKVQNMSITELSFPYSVNGTPTSIARTSATSVNNGTGCVSCGGETAANTALNKCFTYNGTTQKWSPLPDLPQIIRNTAMVSIADDFFVIGGYISSGDRKEMYRYNTVDNQWHVETPVPNAGRSHHAAATLSSTEFIACGGFAPLAHRSDCEIYNIETQLWRAAGALNGSRAAFAMVVFEGEVHALGGMSNGVYLATFERYDRDSDTWTTVARPMTTGRSSFVALVVDT